LLLPIAVVVAKDIVVIGRDAVEYARSNSSACRSVLLSWFGQYESVADGQEIMMLAVLPRSHWCWIDKCSGDQAIVEYNYYRVYV
jgi:hypothetical protein